LRNINTLFIGKVFLHFPTLDSTNKYAADLLAKTKPAEGTVISTADQYAGRGQIGSNWESVAGQNSTFSVILYPHFVPVRQQFMLNQAVALAVRDAIASVLDLPVNVKWPNDIYVNDKKVCGILIQNSIAGSTLQNSIVGIGINVNQTHFSSRATKASSLRLETGQAHSPDDLIAACCEELEHRYLQLKNGHKEELKADYFQHLYRYQEEAWFAKADGTKFLGIITGISPIGQLEVQTADGLATFDIKAISFL